MKNRLSGINGFLSSFSDGLDRGEISCSETLGFVNFLSSRVQPR